jgi:hypothetical protein
LQGVFCIFSKKFAKIEKIGFLPAGFGYYDETIFQKRAKKPCFL